MKNKYYTNRNYRNTDKIRIAVSNMNKDIRELSEYCDKLEQKLEQKENIIKEVREYIEKNYDDYEEFIYGKEFKEKILEMLGDKNNE